MIALRIAALALVVATIYALPFALARGRVDICYPDETYYAARVMDAWHGGDLRNPYLAGHERSPKYLPELVERTYALTARSLHVPPLTVLAASRVVLAVALTIALTYFGIALGLSPGMATLAGACPALFPPILTLLQTPGTGEHGFLRLFRIVSPAAHMLLLVVALWCAYVVWKGGRWWQWIAAGIALGVLAYVPIYYWAFAMLGTLLLAIRRRALFWSLLVAAVVSLPHFIHAAQVMRSPEVIETLARLRLMIPGRLPEPDVPRRLIENLIVIAALLLIRNRFLLAFLIAGEVLLVQNAITNRQMQAFPSSSCGRSRPPWCGSTSEASAGDSSTAPSPRSSSPAPSSCSGSPSRPGKNGCGNARSSTRSTASCPRRWPGSTRRLRPAPSSSLHPTSWRHSRSIRTTRSTGRSTQGSMWFPIATSSCGRMMSRIQIGRFTSESTTCSATGDDESSAGAAPDEGQIISEQG